MRSYLWELDTYRYVLGVEGKNPLVYIGLNPSIAIPKHPDMTWNILSGMCNRKGYDGLIIVNLFPKVIHNEENHTVDNENSEIATFVNNKNFALIGELFSKKLENIDYTTLCGWCNDIMLRTKPQLAIERLKKALVNVPTQKIKCLGLTKFGHPVSPIARIKKEELKVFDLKNYQIISKL